MKIKAKMLQHGAKMAPKLLPGGLWAASGAEVAGKVAPGTLLGPSWGAPGALLGRSWPLLGASGASPGGSRRISKSIPEASSEPGCRPEAPELASGGARQAKKQNFANFSKRPICEKCHTLYTKTCFCKVRACARSAKMAKKTT